MTIIVHRVSPREARYTPLGGREKCGACRFYVSPRWCGHVIGPVSPMGWCKYFSREMVQQFGGSQVTGAGMAGPTFEISFMNSTLGTGAVFTRASTGWYTNASGTLVSAATNTPRFDYDPVTLQPKGLLLEDVSTNILLQSTLGPAPWSCFFATVATAVATPNNTTAPDGTTTGTRIVYPAVINATDTCIWYQGFTATAAPYAFSVWLRGSVGGEQTYLCTNAAGFYSGPRITLTTQWQRFTFVTPALTAATWYFCLGTDRRDGTQSGTPAQTIYAWGAQVEAIGYVTSYIPTLAATVTRAADVLRYPIASVTGFDQTKGSLVHEYTLEGTPPGFGAPAFFAGSDTNTDYIYLDQFSGTATPQISFVGAAVGGVTVGATSYPVAIPVSLNVTQRGAVSWALNANLIGAHNGTGMPNVVTGPVVTLPVITDLRVAYSVHYQNLASQWARRVRYWPRQLSQAELIAMTS